MSGDPQPDQPLSPKPLEPAEVSLKEQRQWAMGVHLACFSAYLGVPVGNFLGPLLVWQWKKDEIPGLDQHGRDACNFHLTMTIYMMVCLGFTMFCFVGILPMLALGVYSTVMSVLAAVAAQEGKPYRYPGSIELLK